MSFLYEPGDLAHTPLAAILLEALNLRVTGMLTVQQGGGTSKLYLRAGVPVGAQVYVGFKPLGQYLLSQGLIDIESLEKSLQEMARTGRSQGQVLVEMGAISPVALDRALAEQQSGYVALIAGLESGAYRFDAETPVPEWTRGVRLSPLKAIVVALEKPQAEALVVSALRQAMVQPVAFAPGYAQVAEAFGWSADEAALIQKLERPTAMEAFLSDSRVAPERARAALAALLLLGFAEPTAEGAEATPPLPSVVVDLDDLLEPVAGDPVAVDEAPAPRAAAPAASVPQSAAPAQRSDPAEARARRQRLLARAMQNMGIGPLASRTAPSLQPTARPAATPALAAGAPRGAPSAAEAELRRALAEAAPRAAAKDYFARLGLDRGATPAQVKQAYLTLAKQFHPDRFAAAALADVMPTVKELFSAVNEAYEVLSDEKKRAEYLARTRAGDVKGAAGAAASEAAQLDFKKGEACLKTRDFARARGFLEVAIRQDPKAEYQAALAWCHLMDPASGDREKAKQLVAVALKDPSCDRACYVAGILAREEQDDERAERMFRAALKANPKHVEAEREVRLIELRRQKKGGGPFKKR